MADILDYSDSFKLSTKNERIFAFLIKMWYNEIRWGFGGYDR